MAKNIEVFSCLYQNTFTLVDINVEDEYDDMSYHGTFNETKLFVNFRSYPANYRFCFNKNYNDDYWVINDKHERYFIFHFK